jgi:hypothetical protein
LDGEKIRREKIFGKRVTIFKNLNTQQLKQLDN